MKKMMKRFIAVGAVVSAIAAVTSMPAMAADYAEDNNSVAYAVPTPDSDTSMTIIVVPKGAEVTYDNIYYINQNKELSGDALLKGKKLADGTYVVKVGYYKDGEFAIMEDEFVVGETVEDTTYTLGDVDNDGVVTVLDALCTVQAVAGINELTNTQILAADVDKDNLVTVLDALDIAKYIAGLIEF